MTRHATHARTALLLAFTVLTLGVVSTNTTWGQRIAKTAGPTAVATRATGTIQTIVAVGDSVTRGAGDTDVSGGWVARLGEKLHAAYPTAAFAVRNAGLDGDTTAGVLARLTRDVLAAHPALVIISSGTNDFDEDVPPALYETRLRALVGRLRVSSRPPIVILAGLLPIAGQAPARLASERAYNAIIRRTAVSARVGYLDLFDIWLALGPTYLRALRQDAEHPNPLGYEFLAGVTSTFLQAGYLDARGRIVAPASAPTCDAALCGP